MNFERYDWAREPQYSNTARHAVDLALLIKDNAKPLIDELQFPDLRRVARALRGALDGDKILREKALSARLLLYYRNDDNAAPYADIADEGVRLQTLRDDLHGAWKQLKLAKCVVSGV